MRCSLINAFTDSDKTRHLPLLVWKLKPSSRIDSWLIIKATGNITRVSSRFELFKILKRRKPSNIYTNVYYEELSELSEHKVWPLSLTAYEYNLLFKSLSIWNPDDQDESVVLGLESAVSYNDKDSMSLIKWLLKYDKQFGLLNRDLVTNKELSKPEGGFVNVHRWLSRPHCRLFPNNVVMDTHVYCQRWSPTHWSQTLKQPLIHTEPIRNSSLLKACRTDPKRLQMVDQIAFALVNITSTNQPIDWPLKQSVWVTNIELNAMVNLDKKLKFTVEDILTVSDSDTSTLDSDWLDDETLQLSLTHGVACRNHAYKFSNTWTMAWWRGAERAHWIALLGEVQNNHQLTVSGYGDGYVSFYCWSGEVSKLCSVFRMKAAVLKLEDKDFDAELKQEFSASLRQQYEDSDDLTREQQQEEREVASYEHVTPTTF